MSIGLVVVGMGLGTDSYSNWQWNRSIWLSHPSEDLQATVCWFISFRRPPSYLLWWDLLNCHLYSQHILQCEHENVFRLTKASCFWIWYLVRHKAIQKTYLLRYMLNVTKNPLLRLCRSETLSQAREIDRQDSLVCMVTWLWPTWSNTSPTD